jgi:hypothetical protein
MKDETKEYLFKIWEQAQLELVKLIESKLSCDLTVQIKVHQGGIRSASVKVEKPV